MSDPRKPTRPRNTTCADCGRTDCAVLFVKRAVWKEAGRDGKQVKSRTMKIQCQECAELDPDYQRRPLVDAPGNVDWAPKEAS